MQDATLNHTDGRKSSTLPASIAGDISAAAISATLIAPLVTAIDRAVVENAASGNRPLLPTLRAHIACSFRHPRAFFNAKPFFLVWTLYAATYSTANATDTITKTFMEKADQALASSITFLSTCIVNVPLGVCKDLHFVKAYGGSTTPNLVGASKAQAPTTLKIPPSKHAGYPKLAGATFLFRDAVTILGSFTLAPMLSASVPDSIASDPKVRAAVTQLVVPILSQVAATPVHLLGLDLCSFPHKIENTERMRRITRNLGPMTVMRCCRIVPAFGFGCVMNMNLREYFHDKAGTTNFNETV